MENITQYNLKNQGPPKPYDSTTPNTSSPQQAIILLPQINGARTTHMKIEDKSAMEKSPSFQSMIDAIETGYTPQMNEDIYHQILSPIILMTLCSILLTIII